MPVIADARATPSIAVQWIKNNILAAIISGVATLCVSGTRYATGAAEGDAGLGGLAILYATAAMLWAFSGSADGLLSGAVLQRIVPLLPARTWIGLHALMAVAIGVGSEWLVSGGAKSTDDASLGEVLAAGLVSGAFFGAVIGGLQALVLRRVALGTGAWIAWSSGAFAIAMAFFAGSTRVLDAGGGLAGELVGQVIGFLTAVIIALVMLPALQRLRDPMLSRAGEYFS